MVVVSLVQRLLEELRVYFVCVDALCPIQHFFSYVAITSCLPGLNPY